MTKEFTPRQLFIARCTGLALLALSITNCVSSNTKTQTVTQNDTICHGIDCVYEQVDIMSVSPGEVSDLCSSNGMQCRRQFDEKTALVYATVSSIKHDSGDRFRLNIVDNDNYFASAHCYIKPGQYAENFYNYRKGDPIILRGQIDIDTIGFRIDDCQVISRLPQLEPTSTQSIN